MGEKGGGCTVVVKSCISRGPKKTLLTSSIVRLTSKILFLSVVDFQMFFQTEIKL